MNTLNLLSKEPQAVHALLIAYNETPSNLQVIAKIEREARIRGEILVAYRKH
jgi:hypothetical protein